MRSSNRAEGLSFSLRKMEKARNARITTPPTEPPMIRMVLVLLLVEVPDVLAAALADVEEEGVVSEIVGLVDVDVVEGSGAGIPEDDDVESSLEVVGVDEVVWTRAASVMDVGLGVGDELVVGVLVVVGVEVVVGAVGAVEVAVTT